MTETRQPGNMMLSGGRDGNYRDKFKKFTAILKKRIRFAHEQLKQTPAKFLNKAGKEIRWLWRKSINGR